MGFTSEGTEILFFIVTLVLLLYGSMSKVKQLLLRSVCGWVTVCLSNFLSVDRKVCKTVDAGSFVNREKVKQLSPLLEKHEKHNNNKISFGCLQDQSK